MRKDCKVAVLVTFYNQEKYVDKALGSIFSQKTDFSYKVIVGDDGSTDGTMDKVNSWLERYPDQIYVICQEREAGEKYIGGSRASKNRLALLKMVDTPYFIFLDGDDYWTDDEKLQVQYDILENKDNVDCIASAHQILLKHESEEGQGRLIPGKIKEQKLSLKEYWGRYYFHTDTILFRSNHINDIRHDLLEEAFNDNLITYSFLQFGKIHFLPRDMAVYYQNSKGIWAGEKRAVGIVRNIMSYDIEVMINKNMKNICDIRHRSEFWYLKRNKNLVVSIDREYLNIARKYSLKTMENALMGRPLLCNNNMMDYILIICMRLHVMLKKLLYKLQLA